MVECFGVIVGDEFGDDVVKKFCVQVGGQYVVDYIGGNIWLVGD